MALEHLKEIVWLNTAHKFVNYTYNKTLIKQLDKYCRIIPRI